MSTTLSTHITKDKLPTTISSSSNLTMSTSSSTDPKSADISNKVKSDDNKNTEGVVVATDTGTSESKSLITADMAKRFLPAYKKANAALTFPEKMMNLMKYVEERNKTDKDFCISWLPEGKAFVIYNIKEFTSSVVPKFFKASKFCSFTRKLYRWGFRQLNRGIGPDEPIIFGNEFFQRDNADLMVNMRSITAASIRKRESDLLRHMLASKKRALMSWDAASNGAHQDPKQLNMLLNNTPFDQKQQNASLATAANAMASQQRFGGDGCYSTELSHLNNQQLQMLYRNCTGGMPNNAGVSGDGSIVPIITDAVSQMNNPSPYNNFNVGGSSHPQDFNNAMSSMPMPNNSSNSSSMMGGPTSNYMSHMNGQNGNNSMCETNGSNGRMNNMNNNNNAAGFNGSFNNNMFSSDGMYGNGSSSNNTNRGNNSRNNFNLAQQYNNSGTNGDNNNSISKTPNNHDNSNYNNYNSVPMNMNINQHLFNLSSTSAAQAAAGSDEGYFGQY